MTETTCSFFPAVDHIEGSKKLELSIELQENPVILRQEQDYAVARGQVTLVCREPQKGARNLKLQLIGTKELDNIQQMGSVGSAKQTILKAIKEVPLKSDQDTEVLAKGTYQVPFEFVMDKSSPPTTHVPRCQIHYMLTASVEKPLTLPYLRLFTSKQVKQQAEVRLVKYTADLDPSDFMAKIKPVVKMGTLGGAWNGEGPLPFRVAMNKNVAAPGDVLSFTLDIYPPISDPKNAPEFTQGEFSSLIHVATNHKANKEGAEDESEDEEEEVEDSQNVGTVQQHKPSASTSDNSKGETSNDDEEAEMEEGVGEPPSHVASPMPMPVPMNRPPTYHSDHKDDTWAIAAAQALSGKKAAVTSYKVTAKLVQRVCYLTDHDLVADTACDVYMFWTKRMVHKERVSAELDLLSVPNDQKPIHLEWSLKVPEDQQYDLLTSDLQVRYDVYLDFRPRDEQSSLKGVVNRVSSKVLSARLPLRVLPVSISSLLAHPPSYN